MKVGITYNGDITYRDYTAGDTSVYAFTEGDGHYTIALYSNVSGTKYRLITKKIVKVLLDNDLSPFLVSTKEVEFSKDDAVSQKAAEICNGLTDTSSKIIALHGYIHDNISYDYAFAADVSSGKIKTYTPKATEILSNHKGICYDFATLYAAMCRSQGIPCRIKKGYYRSIYHAWNEVYIDGLWYKVDTTTSMNKEILKKNLTKKEENK
jgi:transglutaminase-like putative cysteine protease